MKRILLLLPLVILFLNATGQTGDYKTFVKEANDLYSRKKYKEAGLAFSKAFASFGGKGYVNDRYIAACTWSLADDNDSAFFQLDRLATKGNYTDYSRLIKDSDLDKLHKDKRWDALCAQVKQNKDKAEANLNKDLMSTLDTVFKDDQEGRQLLGSIEKQFGPSSPQLNELWGIIKKNDSIDLVKVKRIIDTYGWLGPDVVGGQGSETIFLVIQHADIKTQQHYLPIMREAVKNKKASPSSLALLEDRVALGEGRKQVYGSQIHNGKNGEKWVSALEDPDNVDKRRAEVGLGPLAEYIKHWNLNWDVEAYKKQLPELERREKEK